MLFGDDAAVAIHTNGHMQDVMDYFFQACQDFGLTANLKKTNVMIGMLKIPSPSASPTVKYLLSPSFHTLYKLLMIHFSTYCEIIYYSFKTGYEYVEQQAADHKNSTGA